MADDRKKGKPPEGQPALRNLTAAEAAELMQGAANSLRQQWLQTAVTLANVLKGGQSISLGAIEDLRRMRENYEEIERARLFLASVKPVPEGGPEPGG